MSGLFVYLVLTLFFQSFAPHPTRLMAISMLTGHMVRRSVLSQIYLLLWVNSAGLTRAQL
jgi:hypothetical protein